MRCLVTAVIFLDSALSQDLAHVLIGARAGILKKFFIFLLHYCYDKLQFFQKSIKKNRYL